MMVELFLCIALESQVFYPYVFIMRIGPYLPVPFCLHGLHDGLAEGEHVAGNPCDPVIFHDLHPVVQDVCHVALCRIRIKFLSNQFAVIVLEPQAYPVAGLDAGCGSHLYLKCPCRGISCNICQFRGTAVMLEFQHCRGAVHDIFIFGQVGILHHQGGLVHSCAFQDDIAPSDPDYLARTCC